MCCPGLLQQLPGGVRQWTVAADLGEDPPHTGELHKPLNKYNLRSQDVSGWSLQLDFSSSVSDVNSPMATSAGSGSHWTLTNKEYDGDLTAGQEFSLRFAVYYPAAAPDLVNMKFNGASICDDERHHQEEAEHTPVREEERAGGGTVH